MKKTLYTLNIGNYEPEVTALTYPLMRRWANKIGADFVEITERKYPKWPVVYEKFQIYDLAQQNGSDWNIFLDADTLVHPDFWDITAVLTKDVTSSAFSSDFTPVRFKPDKYFMRDGRFIGKGNWCLVASDWCLDIWHPLEDLTLEQAVANITPMVMEVNRGLFDGSHLIDDYVVSRNIARYGLKHVLISQLEQMKGAPTHVVNFDTVPPQALSYHLWHDYTVPGEQKTVRLQRILNQWKVKP